MLPLGPQNYSELPLLPLFFAFFFLGLPAKAQSFDPPAGKVGSRAIAHNSLAIRLWASRVQELRRGPKNCADQNSGLASSGSAESALGAALENGVLSLGDGGSIVLAFPVPLMDGPGPDFAVFENGFSDGFLELATVEVSSNGSDFFSFPCFSETQTETQTRPFDTLDARNLHNLAGKYRAGFGTGFDLFELKGNSQLDLSAVAFIRIRDVVGCLNPAYGTRDSEGRLINDPWPTDFESGGFDLDAVAALHVQENPLPQVWPSQLRAGENFNFIIREGATEAVLYSAGGSLIARYPAGSGQSSRIPAGIQAGVYFLGEPDRKKSRKILVR